MTTDTEIVARRVSSVNPSTGEILRQMECASELEVRAAVTKAATAQVAWATSGIQHRISIVKKFQSELLKKKSEIAMAVTRETGKPVAEATTTEILVALDAARFLIDNAFRFLRDEPVPHGNLAAKLKSGRLVREPYGVIGIISPWNYPFSIPATEALAALVAGNAVVLKPSEFTSLVALELDALFHSAGLPDDVFRVVVGDRETGAALVLSPIDKLVFTGSVAAGKRIAAVAAERLLPVVLELGGKDPMIVLDDANIDVSSSAAIWGAFVNAGQTCISVERCYVQRNRYDDFLEACVEKTKSLRVGRGFDTEADIGPMIHERQLQVVEDHVQDAIRHGARLLAGGHRIPELGDNFYAPTILGDVTHEMRIMREETFGPVLPVMPFDTEEDGLRLANDSEYALAASVWTGDSDRGMRLARRIAAGTVMVNDVVSSYGISEAPHGGAKSSGIGRTHGRFGLEEMVRAKYLDSDRMPGMKKVWWYSYGKGFARQMAGFLDFQFASRWATRLGGALRAADVVTRKRL